MLYLTFRVILRLLFRLFLRLKVEGMENIPSQGPVVLCANHISNLDPPLLGTPLNRRVHYMAKEELFRIPLFGSMIRQLGAFPVKRGGVSKESIRSSIQLLNEGKMLGIFPQGSRKNTSGIGKKGAALLALRSDAVVIPVGIVGPYGLFRRMTLRFGKPVDLSEFRDSESDQLEAATAKIMDAIEQQLKQPQHK